MRKHLPLVLTICLLFSMISCQKSGLSPKESEAYFPLQVGNYWKVNDTDYLEITGTKVIGGAKYFEITSHTPGGTGTIHLRLDDDLNLIQAYTNTNYTRIIANLGFKEGKKLKDDIEEGTVIARDSEKLVYRYKCMLCSQSNAIYEVAFYKNRGILSRNLLFSGYLSGNPAFTEIRIDGKVYHP